MPGWDEFGDLNRGYVLELYERFRSDPGSVDPESRAIFERWTPPASEDAGPVAESALGVKRAVGAPIPSPPRTGARAPPRRCARPSARKDRG